MNTEKHLRMGSVNDIERKLKAVEAELARFDAERDRLVEKLRTLRAEKAELLQEAGSRRSSVAQNAPSLFDVCEPAETYKTKPHFSGNGQDTPAHPPAAVTENSPAVEKIKLFLRLFRGRDDVYARRFESRKTGKSGYAPVCRNEWVPGVCEKPRIACQACNHRAFEPVTPRVIRNHLLGCDLDDSSHRDFTVGVYAMCLDETCWFLAVDFDKAHWPDDASAYIETCRRHNVPAALERSRSGSGAHVWTFFSEPVPAALARNMGSYLLTRTMERRPEIGMDSYDRFFPSQDTLPDGGFGNLIALPLQQKPRSAGNSVFVDAELKPHPDQWAFLSSLGRMSRRDVELLASEAPSDDDVLAIRRPPEDEAGREPWSARPSRQLTPGKLAGPLPKQLDVVLGNQIYIPKDVLTPPLRNRLIRLAAFQNPEFYSAQSMRMSTFGKPRIISCAEDYPEHIALPRGCMADLIGLLDDNGIELSVDDQRQEGAHLDVEFAGELRPDQAKAAEAMLRHDIGVLSAATAFGKSVVGAYLIAQRGVNTLVFVHRRQLLEQWTASLTRFLSLNPEDIGTIGGGKRAPTGNVDVATIQSLVRKGIVDDIVADYGHVLVDECHHISAVSFERVIREAKARYITGLSATVVRKDGHHPIIFMQCGPIRHRVDDRKQAERRPIDHHVVVRTTPFELPHDDPTPHIQNVYAMVAKDEDRNRMIVRDVLNAVENGRCPVVLTERRNHVETLTNLLSDHLPNVFPLSGGLTKKQRRVRMEAIGGVGPDEPRVFVSTGRYLGEGFDDERLDTLFLTLPVSWRGTIAQYAGRLHRIHERKKDALIYDYVDARVPMLARMHDRRRAGYKALGYEIIEPSSPPAQLAFGKL